MNVKKRETINPFSTMTRLHIHSAYYLYSKSTSLFSVSITSRIVDSLKTQGAADLMKMAVGEGWGGDALSLISDVRIAYLYLLYTAIGWWDDRKDTHTRVWVRTVITIGPPANDSTQKVESLCCHIPEAKTTTPHHLICFTPTRMSLGGEGRK
ncbi:hypothetical protein E2C01_064020 [Portunus trituberculatus]|uniref:Uncharacterized protein n=1 Tax=Portunus trituberculatus TaxID=210409 RepID=A0A5B7HJ81_PORTR|nr:hypothetical protein [Portunus trituberculatus]